MKECPARETTQFDPNVRFQSALEPVDAGETIDFVPADKADNDLLRVLIVDDHRATANTLSSLVTRWGHDARCAYDGVTGLVLAAAFQPDVLLLDILMPDVSGIEVAIQMRRQHRLEHCFIVAVTGRTDESHRRRCYEAGADLVLIKPVVPVHMKTLLSLETQRVRSREKQNSTVSVSSHPQLVKS
jgi:two-component system alkaline phosphatase synthesis response regulator PhoP